jgi:parallel beta-helix repeat protein
VTLESGDSVPARYHGIGIAARNVDRVTIEGGRILGYRHGIVLDGGSGHVVRDADLSGSRQQALRSDPARYDEADWLDIFHPDTFVAYGGGLLLRNTSEARIERVVARGAQNGIGLLDVRDSYLAGNDVSHNSGWGIHLWRSSRNVIVRNQADSNVRCESPSYSRGCDSAALLLRERSDSNYLADNDLTRSGDGFFLSGHRGMVQPSLGNVVVRNDASFAYHNAFESTFSPWNIFLDNRADSSQYGFWLGYSTGNTVRGNTIIGTVETGIAIEHGSDNEIAGNVIIGGETGIHLFAPGEGDASRGYRVDDNTLAQLRTGVRLESTTRVRLRGNLFDGVTEGLVADAAAADAQVSGNVFLRASGLFVRADTLDAGGNFWGTPDLPAAKAKVRGNVNLVPWTSAREAGY